MGRFSYTTQAVHGANEEEDGLSVTLLGDLDEHSDFAGLVAELHGDRLVFDLEGIARLNSGGVHRWVLFLEQVGAGREVSLIRCSANFVTQALMIDKMTAGARVESAYVSFWCESCGRSCEMLLRSVAEVCLEQECRKCSRPMELDTPPELYAVLFGPGR